MPGQRAHAERGDKDQGGQKQSPCVGGNGHLSLIAAPLGYRLRIIKRCLKDNPHGSSVWNPRQFSSIMARTLWAACVATQRGRSSAGRALEWHSRGQGVVPPPPRHPPFFLFSFSFTFYFSLSS